MLTAKDREHSFKILFIAFAVERKLKLWLQRMNGRWLTDEETYRLLEKLFNEAKKMRERCEKRIGLLYLSGTGLCGASKRRQIFFYLDCKLQIQLEAIGYRERLRRKNPPRLRGRERREAQRMEQSLLTLARRIDELYQRTMALPFDENWDRILIKSLKSQHQPAIEKNIEP